MTRDPLTTNRNQAMDVLIVEDDDSMASALSAAVASAGHTPSGFPAGPTPCWCTAISR